MQESFDQSGPLVSIGILSYNRAQTIGKVIESIQSQNYKNLEILISDDASADEAVHVCQGYIERDSRITLFTHDVNIGPYRNYDFLVNQAKGKYFMWMSDDDQLKPNVINRYVEFLENNGDYNLVSGQIQYWKNGELRFIERGLSQESPHKLGRVLSYYAKVKEGAIFYGLMRLEDLRNVKLIKSKLAGDWHLVAHMIYFSKVKQLDFVSMSKASGGFSSDWKRYAKVVGASGFAARFPFIAIGLDTFNDLLTNSKIYGNESKAARFIVGLGSCLIIWLKYYVRTYPRIVGGRVKRFFAAYSKKVPILIKSSGD